MAKKSNTSQLSLGQSNSPSFARMAFDRLKKNRLAYFSLWMIGLLAMVALFADLFAYHKPIYAVYEGETYFPILYDYLAALGLYQWKVDLILADWKDLSLDSAFWPAIRYSPQNLDLMNAMSISPFEDQRVPHWKYWHYLGTDEVGRDILSGLIHGSRVSLTVGLVAVGISAAIGIFLGACAGYFGDNQLKMSRIRVFTTLVGIFLGFFYGFFIRKYTLSESLDEGFGLFFVHLILSVVIFLALSIGLSFAGKPLERIPFLGKKVNIWLDIMVSRLIEVVQAMPRLLLIITIAAISKPSIYLVMVIIGLTSWTGIARFIRGEMLRIRNLEYTQAARSLGYRDLRIIFKHAIPNGIAPVLVSVAFTIAAAILMESALSFLGIGVPADSVTWGSLLASARNTPSAWWLTIFPGFAIFVTVTVFNLLGDGLRDSLDPRLRE